MELDEALRALIPAADAGFRAWEAAIPRVAALVLQGATLRVGDARLRVLEVEAYVRARWHPDPFTHADPAQSTVGRWYFHRTGGTYRAGTFKGVDLTFGAEGVHAGLLIRAVRSGEGARVEGPSCVVDHALQATRHATVASLARACEAGDHDALALTLDDPPRRDAVYAGPRVGLSLRPGATPERVFFLPRPYRFVVDPRGAKKGRAAIALGMHMQGASPPAIAGITGSALAQVRRWIDAFDAGRAMAPESLRGAEDGEALCALLGACTAHGHE